MIKKEDWLFSSKLSVKDIIFGVTYHSGGAVILPIVIYLSLGFVLDKIFGTKPIFMIVCLVLSFGTTNYLLYKKTRRLITISQEETVKKGEN